MSVHSTSKKIGLFGGTFDPPHNGHVALVEAGLKLMGLDEVWVIPAEPVHRSLSGNADGPTRFGWLHTIFSEEKDVQVLDWEIGHGRPVAAVETLRDFRQRYPEIVPWLMMGADAWTGLEGWREYPGHRNLCNVAVFARAGMQTAQLPQHDGWRKVDESRWRECHSPGHWCYLPVSLPDISATELRGEAERGTALEGRVPESVRSLIEKSYRVVV